MKRFFKYLPVLIPVTLIITFSLLFYTLSPEGVIGLIGVENAYILMFILSVVGGLSTFSAVPYHIVLIALAVGGINPLLLGIVTAVGVMIGDSTSYYLGYHGRVLMSERVQEFFDRLSYIKEKYPRLLPLVFFLYGSFLPFSNDLIVIPMGFLRYPFWRVMIPLGIGNIIFNIGLAYIAAYAYSYLQVFPFF